MSESEKSALILQSILEALQQINSNLQKHEQRWDALQTMLFTNGFTSDQLEGGRVEPETLPLSNPISLPDLDDSTTLYPLSKTSTVTLETILTQATTSTSSNDSSQGSLRRGSSSLTKPEDIEIVPYTEWGRPLAKSPLHEFSFVQRSLGEIWTLPDDARIPLGFSRHALEDVLEKRGEASLSEHVENICRFDQGLFSPWGSSPDLWIFDVGVGHVVKKYQIVGNALNDSIGVAKHRLPEINRSQAEDESSLTNPRKFWSVLRPWQRLIICKGLDPEVELRDMLFYYPWLPVRFKVGLEHYQKCHRYVSPTNPYLTQGDAFLVTFYEILPAREPLRSQNLRKGGKWVHGPLYGDGLKREFRESAFLIMACTSIDDCKSRDPSLALSRQWTIAVLCPPDSFTTEYGHWDWDADIIRENATMLLTCLAVLSKGLQAISGKWAEFQSYFERLFDEKPKIMKPAEHDQLLIDDDRFSRSRKYFWTLNCLTELEECIANNIQQVDFYITARVTPLLHQGRLSEAEVDLLGAIKLHRDTLWEQRIFFQRKIESVKGLRDGLLSASAVAESRSATRLGENVKLLTFVSIFFLPLGFCTQLWSINDKFSTSAFISVIIVVGIFTYFVVFNLNNMVELASMLYDKQKRRVIRQMVGDSSEWWQATGERLHVVHYKPKTDEPSEWWLFLYCFRSILRFQWLKRAARPHSREL